MAKQHLRLGEETLGDRIHRAYRRCKAETGLVYLDHATAISEIVPVSDQTLMRLEQLDDLPSRPRQRQTLFLMMLAYGFDPHDFGLTEESAGLGAFDMRKVRRVLDPASRSKHGAKNVYSSHQAA